MKKLPKPLAVFRCRPPRWGRAVPLAALAVLVPAAIAAVGYWRANVLGPAFGPAAVSAWGRPWYAAAAAAALPLVILLGRGAAAARLYAAVYPKGVRLRPAWGRQQDLLWSRIEGLSLERTAERFLGRTLAERLAVTIYPTVGKPLRFDDRLADLEGLAAHIQGQIEPLLLPELRAQLRAGRWVDFGGVQISQGGVRCGKFSQDWTAVQAITVQAGELLVTPRAGEGVRPRPAGRVPLGKIRNLDLLLALLAQEITDETTHLEP